MPAKSKAQQRLFGMIYAAKKKGKKLPPRLQRIADRISLQDAHDFAETPRRGLPEKVEKQSRWFRWPGPRNDRAVHAELLKRAAYEAMLLQSWLSQLYRR